VVSLRRITLILALSGVLTAGIAQAASPRTYSFPRSHFAITIPGNWQFMPRSPAALRAKVRALRARGKRDLAGQYAAALKDPYVLRQLRQHLFTAFEWPALPAPIATDVSVRSSRVPDSFTKNDLADTAKVFADQFRTGKGRVTALRAVALPAGPAELVRGTVPLGPGYHGAATGFTLYVLLNRHTLYLISFRVDSRFLNSRAELFASIARSFRFL
jgi:hypothetical protein